MSMVSLEIVNADVLAGLKWVEDSSISCVVTSPPYYGLRDYGVDGQIGLEETPEAYVQRLVDVFREVRRTLRDDGTLWLNIGDSFARDARKGQHKPGDPGEQAHVYERGGGRASTTLDLTSAGLKPKDLIGIPWMLAFALRADGWYLRSDIIWHKTNAMPESVKDRPTKAHEYIFLLTKSERYYYDAKAIEEDAKWERWGNQTEKKQHRGTAGHLGGKTLAELPIRDKKNRRTVWSIPTKPLKDAHFAAFPPDLADLCVLAGCPEGGTVLDPFCGAATTLLVAGKNNRNGIGIELNPEYCDISKNRLSREGLHVQVYTDSMEEAAATNE